MCEAHSNGGRDHSSSWASTQHHQSLDAQPTPPTTNNTSSEIATTCSSDVAACIAPPISLPTSPPLSPCINLQSPQHGQVDMLAYRLRHQSLMQQNFGSVSNRAHPSAALSPTSLPDDNLSPYRVVSRHYNSVVMEVDVDESLTLPPVSAHDERQTYEKGLGIMVPASTSGCSNFDQPLPSALNPPAVPSARTNTTGPAPQGSNSDLIYPALEVDEGYCEDEDDFSWLEAIVSLKSSSSNETNSLSTAGIKKRYGLRYRSSSEAATRCSNAVHSIPRMRRRDKKRRKPSRPMDASTIEHAANATL
ncbi:hypothetical protein EDB81DRAFT_882982 [Dactylonectria macrodidyma]|uniref:Uncharacterized protein n=1 Tax=Dactylonectria macrodidyma TaxID=307937 RepID=A0A9P9J567_9HYPO|nr:hypothetical protein EDB81DRAFT_882982 [Dactylonectria macrodidyma]